MPRVDQHQRGTRCIEVGHLTLHGQGVSRARDQVIHRHAHLEGSHQLGMDGAQQRRKLTQHLLDLAIHVGLRLAPGVAQVHRFGGLDEQRPRAGRLIVHDARRPVARVPAHRDHVASPADGHGRLARRIELPHDALQPAHQPLARGLHLAPRRRQGRARRVEYLAGVINAPGQAPVHCRVGERHQQRGGPGRLSLHAQQLPGGRARGGKQPGNVPKRQRLQHGAVNPQACEGRRHVGYRRCVQSLTAPEQRQDLAHHRQVFTDRGQVGAWPARQDGRGTDRPGREAGNDAKHRLELEVIERAGLEPGDVKRGARRCPARHPAGS